MKEKGYVHVYTGNGKGKTTASLGLALRAAGAGLRVFFGQFLKSGVFSEVQSLQRLSPEVTLRQFGTGRFINDAPSDEDRTIARDGLDETRTALLSGNYDLVILDEANVAVTYGLFNIADLIRLVDEKPDRVELVITGRNAHPELVEKADLVTEMRLMKHYADQGVKARRGIEK